MVVEEKERMELYYENNNNNNVNCNDGRTDGDGFNDKL